MSELVINSISGVSLPYDLYICDVYGNQCVLVSTINILSPSPITIVLPPIFESAPAIGIKIIDNIGCEHFTINYCS